MGVAAINPSYAALAALLAGLAGGVAGYRYADAQGAARLAQCVQGQAEQQARALALTNQRIQAVRAAGDAAVQAEAVRRLASDQKAQEVQRAIYHLSTGRPCLGAGLVGLLNRAPGIGAGGSELPADSGGAADAAAGVAAAASLSPGPSPQGGGEIDDASVAAWIADAARQYDACRGRIDALRAWARSTE